jgi:hypothetical protein
MALGREMLKQCESVNHPLTCATGPVKFIVMKHLMQVSVGDSSRVVILKGVPNHQVTGAISFKMGLYKDEECLESYVLTIDPNLMCTSKAAGKKELSVTEVCQRILSVLCTPASNITLMW